MGKHVIDFRMVSGRKYILTIDEKYFADVEDILTTANITNRLILFDGEAINMKNVEYIRYSKED